MEMVINGDGYQWKWLPVPVLMEMVINGDGFHLR